MRVYAIAILLALASSPGILLATDYTVNNGSYVDITEWAVCKRVTNNHASGLKIFVPAETSTEWSSFYTNPPPGVSVAACPSACGGASVGGYCWYWTPTTSSCDSACASHGGCNLAGTRDYVGSGGTGGNCVLVFQAIGGFYTENYGGTTNFPPSAIGCYTSNGITAYRQTANATTCGATYSNSGYWRVCACNN